MEKSTWLQELDYKLCMNLQKSNIKCGNTYQMRLNYDEQYTESRRHTAFLRHIINEKNVC